MNKCAVIIGVNTTGGLPVLSAAVKGAKEVNEWAQSQDYNTTLLVDESGPVTVSDIQKAIKQYVNERTYSLLLIYFSGHGILKSSLNEYWLLSEAPENPNEAVNLPASKMLARKTGIPHIVFISDACRSSTGDSIASEVTGSVIFPNMPQQLPLSVIDMFYATVPGNPAYEAKIEVASQNYKGLYTNCLLKGLRGEVPEVIKDINEISGPISVVLAYELKQYLETAVPQAAELISIVLTQNPDAEITSREPKYLSKVKRAKERGPVFSKGMAFDNPPHTHKSIHPSGREFSSEFNEDVNKLTNQPLDHLSISGTSFIIRGSERISAMLDSGLHQTFAKENGAKLLTIDPDTISTLFLQLNNGNTVPLAVIPDYTCRVLMEKDQVIEVTYMPSQSNYKYGMAMERIEELKRRRAMITTEVRYGQFKPEGDPNELLIKASYLRNAKSIDPTLGLYASYAYAQSGYQEGIESIYRYMSFEPEPILFDVDMLTKISGSRYNPTKKVACCCPMLSQGWSYMAVDPALFPEYLHELSKYLVPGLWTTFNPKGTDLVKNLIFNHIIR